MTADLADFLLARIAEDEAAARVATPGPWRWDNDEFDDAPQGTCKHRTEWADHGPNLETVSGVERRGSGPYNGHETWHEPDAVVISASGYDASSLNIKRADAEHIARHDPARVLAECSAKRRIVELGVCTACATEAQPCDHRADTLRLLALPYADHEDYREEWTP